MRWCIGIKSAILLFVVVFMCERAVVVARTPAIPPVSRFSRFKSTLSSTQLSSPLLSHSPLFVIQSGMRKREARGALEETNTYFIPGYLLGADAALFQALRGREWLKNQKSIFTLGKQSVAILHLLGLKHIRVNTSIHLYGKYSTKYNVRVCVCVCTVCMCGCVSVWLEDV